MNGIKGKLTPIGTITGKLSARAIVSGAISMPTEIPVEEYDGSYEVTPRLEEQTLDTQGYKMRNDVVVHTIPVVFTSNIHGGKTVVIG